MNSQPVLQCINLVKTFSDADLSVDVLQGVDLEVSAGERTAIIGASGSGKSTLLHLLGGLDIPSDGEVRILGNNFSVLSEKVRGDVRNQKLGFIYQFHHLLPEFTAIENVAIPLLIRHQISPADAEKTATDLLVRVGLGKRLQHKPGELSGGERQRAAIARALVTRPQCILADEPTGNLDEHTAQQVFDIMLELNKDYGTSLIMVTHNIQLAEKMDRIYILTDGKLENYDGKSVAG